MARLIDADVLWRKFESEPWYDNADRDEIALPLVDDTPTVDAVEVVHGRWIQDKQSKFEHRYICSACNYRLIDEHCNYCPNCGAKMDGDGNG